MNFDLGGFTFRLDSDHDEWLGMAAERYVDFRAPDAETAIPIRYHVVDKEAALDPAFLWMARQEPVVGKRLGSKLEVRGAGFQAVLDPKGVEISGPLALYSLDLVLRVLWSERMQGGLIVHGAAIVEDGDRSRRGFLCTGPSGSGKSTLAGLFPEAALCDELVGVFSRPGRSELSLAGLPFWRGRAGRAPLEAIYFLVHGKEHRLRELSTREAATRLRSQIVWPSWDASALRRALESFSDLFGSVPIFELAFLPQRDVWPVLTSRSAREAA